MHTPLAMAPAEPSPASRLAMLGHDLNNVLQAAAAAIGLALQGGRLGAADSALLDVAGQALQQGAGMARLFLGQDIPRPCSSDGVELAELVQEMAPLLQHAIAPAMQLELDACALSGRVQVDRSALQRALVNLALNAREACPAGARLRISTDACTLVVAGAGRTPGRYGIVRVADNGPGIDPAVAARVFEPGASSRGPGRGLGLAQVRAAVEASGGFVDVQSSPRRGTCFLLALPSITT